MAEKVEGLDAGFVNDEVVEEPEKKERNNEDLILCVVQNDIEAAKKNNREKAPEWDECYKLYRARSIGTERKGRSQVVSSDVQDSVEWILPQMMRLFFSAEEIVKCAPVGAEDAQKSEMHTKLLNYQFLQGNKGFEKSYLWMKSAFIYGLSILKVTWSEEFKENPFEFAELDEASFLELEADPEVRLVEFQEVSQVLPAPEVLGIKWGQDQVAKVYRDVVGTRIVKIYEGPRLELVPLEDFYVDPIATSIEDARFCCHRVFRTVDELNRMQEAGIYHNVDKIQVESATGHTDEADTRKLLRASEDGKSAPWDLTEPIQKARKEVEVWEYWGLIDPNESGRLEPYLVVVVDNVIIRCERNPYNHGDFPFVALRPSMVPFQFDGVGMAHLVGEFQKAKTSILRQMLDNLSFINNQMWLVDRNAGVEMESLIQPRPGGVVRTDDLRGVTNVTPQPLQGVSIQALEFLQTQMEQRHGITRYNQGLDAKSLNKTATGITSIMSASQQRIELVGRIFSETGFKRLFQLMMSLNQQFISQDFVIRVFNEPVEIKADDLKGNFDVTVVVGASVGKEEAEQQYMMTLLQMSPQLMGYGVMTPQNVYNIMSRFLEALGKKDPSEFIAPPQPGMGGLPNGGATPQRPGPSTGPGAADGLSMLAAMGGAVPGATPGEAG